MKTVERTGPELRGQAGGNLRWRFRNRGKPRFADGRQTGIVQKGRDRACGAPENTAAACNA